MNIGLDVEAFCLEICSSDDTATGIYEYAYVNIYIYPDIKVTEPP